MNKTEEIIPTRQWWSSQRRRYNIGLIVAGISAFICYAAIVFTFEDRIPDAEITLFTIIFQGIGYLIMMGIANLLYYLGPIAEKTIEPNNVSRFRTITFGLGYWGSILLPFFIPILLLILVFTQPAWWSGNK
jgi:hypothetical protein